MSCTLIRISRCQPFLLASSCSVLKPQKSRNYCAKICHTNGHQFTARLTQGDFFQNHDYSEQTPSSSKLCFEECTEKITKLLSELTVRNSSMKLPGLFEQNSRNGVIDLPTFRTFDKLVPSTLSIGGVQRIFEIRTPGWANPAVGRLDIELPRTPSSSAIPGGMQCRRLTSPIWQRHRRLKKHHRLKRVKRDWTLICKIHKKRKAAAEKKFRDKIVAMVTEAYQFNPEEYVANIMRAAHTKQVLVKGKALYDYEYYQSRWPHWTETMTVEQLFGVPPSDYIDKKAGFVTPEQWEEIKRLRLKYDETFKERKKS